MLFGLCCALAAVIVTDPRSWRGVLFSLLTFLLWTVYLGVKPRQVLRRAGFFALFFLPFFLTTYGLKYLSMDGGGIARARAALEVPLAIVLRGLFIALLSVTTVRSMSAADLHEGLCRVPGPHTLRTLLVGIVFQIRNLSEETGRIIDAIRVRGGRERAFSGMITAIPRVWLPRVLYRSTRLTDAMTVRGIPSTAVSFRSWPLTTGSVLFGAFFVLWVATSVVLRVLP